MKIDMRFTVLFLMFACFYSASAQLDSTLFLSLKKVESSDYFIMVPEKWQQAEMLDASSKERKFDFTGVSLPAMVNKTPLTATFHLRKYACANLKEAENFLVTEITSYPDRVTPAGFNYLKDSIKIASGELADLYFTHFYRRSKVSNFSRYDMLVYSDKRKAAYILTITYQYRDPSYAAEKDLMFREYVDGVFKTLTLR